MTINQCKSNYRVEKLGQLNYAGEQIGVGRIIIIKKEKELKNIYIYKGKNIKLSNIRPFTNLNTRHRVA